MPNKNFDFTKARWVWIDENRYENNVNNIYSQYLDTFTLQEASKVCLHISADSEYVVWINGRFAAFGQYADFPEYKVYDRIDISSFVKRGQENILAILLYHQGHSTHVYTKGNPGLIYGITSDERNVHVSANPLCRISPDYVSGDLPLTTPQLSFIFEYDGRNYDLWNQIDYYADTDTNNEYSWHKAASYENNQKLFPRPIKKLDISPRLKSKIVSQGVFTYPTNKKENTTAKNMQYSFLSHREAHDLFARQPCTYLPNNEGLSFKKAKDDGEGIYVVLDLEREEAGIFEMDLIAPEGSHIDIAYGEHLDDLRVRSYIGIRNFSGKFIASGKRDEFTHYIKRFGCRYLQLYVNTNEFTLYYAGLRATDYPVEYKGQFESSDSLHNKIYDVSLRTMLLCMHEHYEDCPWREQALYAMDSRNQMLFGYYAFGEYEFARESIRILGISQRDDGLLELCAPGQIHITIPSFCLTWVFQLYEYVLYSGDIEFAREMWPYVEKMIRAFWVRSKGENLLGPLYEDKYWNFYEWADNLFGGDSQNALRDKDNPNNYDAPLNVFYYLALTSAAKLAKLLAEDQLDYDYRDLEAWYEMLATNIKDDFHTVFWNEKERVYATYTINGRQDHYAELTNSLALFAGLVPNDKKSIVARALTQRDDLVKVTISHSIFKYEALMMSDEKYANYVFDDITKNWGYMLYNNATTFWETIDGPWAFSNAGSLCHGWSAVPVLFYYKYVLGISPKNVGFGDFEFKPLKSPLYFAKGTIPSKDFNYHVTISPSEATVKKEKI